MQHPDINDPSLPLSVLFQHWPDAVAPFFARRMLCPSCPVARFYTIADACEEYGLDETVFRAEIIAQIETAKAKGR
jgi:hybrid cluster-associated redox disulfide protein